MACVQTSSCIPVDSTYASPSDTQSPQLCLTSALNKLCLCLNSDVTIQMKASEQYFPAMLLIMLYKVVLNFKSVDEILKCDHSNESY